MDTMLKLLYNVLPMRIISNIRKKGVGKENDIFRKKILLRFI